MKNNLLLSDFYCTLCGSKGLPCYRMRGKEREKGHLKTLYCVQCNKDTNHIEIKPDQRYTFEDFQEEFEYGNFDADGKRIYSVNQLKELVNNGKIEKQKTLGDGRSTGIG